MAVDLDRVKALIRDVPDFPQEGIVFKDITPLLADPIAFSTVASESIPAPIADPAARLTVITPTSAEKSATSTPAPPVSASMPEPPISVSGPSLPDSESLPSSPLTIIAKAVPGCALN